MAQKVGLQKEGIKLPVIKSDNRIADLTKLTYIQLLEIKEREAKLLRNIKRFESLPDKGKRIKDFYERVCLEVKRRADVDEVARRFSDLNIASKGLETVNRLEWSRRIKEERIVDGVDSDDEDTEDPLKIIANHTMHEKKVTVVLEETLITPEDIKEINSFKEPQPEEVVDAEIVTADATKLLKALKINTTVKVPVPNDNREEDPHVKYLVEMGVDLMPTKEKFKPYKTTKSDVHDPKKEMQRAKTKHWDLNAASPPPSQHGPVKMLTLADSFKIQKEYMQRLKELHEKQAEERLAACLQRRDPESTLPREQELKHNPKFTKYRDPPTIFNYIEGYPNSDTDDEIDDMHDDKSEPTVYVQQ